jgi:hypothetical protein
MKSKVLIGGIFTVLMVSLLAYSGSVNAGSDSKASCSYAAGQKVEGKACGNSEACRAMKAHHEKLQAAIGEMGEHLADMENIGDEREWMQEMQQHLVLLQGVLDEMADCPMEGMMHTMMHGHGEGHSDSK